MINLDGNTQMEGACGRAVMGAWRSFLFKTRLQAVNI